MDSSHFTLLSLVALVVTAAGAACTAEVSGPASGGSETTDTSAGPVGSDTGSGNTTSTTSGGVGGGQGEQCSAGELLCDGVCVSPTSSTEHCGSCGNACASGEACVSGTCEANDQSDSGSTNTTGANNATTTGGSTNGGATTGGTGNGVSIGGTCYPICADASNDPDGDDWGWENEESCVVSGSSTEQSGSSCDAGGSPSTTTTTTGTTTTGGMSGSGGTGGGGDSDCSNPGGGSCPNNVVCPSDMPCGCQIVNGLGANKCALLDAGASVYMLASAMMETDAMDTNYAYGDNKTGDSFNAGVCKQNWGMVRQCHTAWQGLGPQDYATSDAMNGDRALDVQVYDECRAYFGDSWWGGHRNGSSGLMNPNTQDIQNFKAAMDWTFEQLPGHETDDVRFWVSVPAIIYLDGADVPDDE